MVRLKARDAAILARVAKYGKLPVEKRRKMLKDATPRAKEIGMVVLGVRTTRNRKVNDAASVLKKWAGGTPRIARDARATRSDEG